MEKPGQGPELTDQLITDQFKHLPDWMLRRETVAVETPATRATSMIVVDGELCTELNPAVCRPAREGERLTNPSHHRICNIGSVTLTLPLVPFTGTRPRGRQHRREVTNEVALIHRAAEQHRMKPPTEAVLVLATEHACRRRGTERFATTTAGSTSACEWLRPSREWRQTKHPPCDSFP